MALCFCGGACDFYPRSPCGERQSNAVDQILPGHISIHALLAESDFGKINTRGRKKIFLSTLSLRRATHQTKKKSTRQIISIHALLAESDRFNPRKTLIILTFLSTLSLRRATSVDCSYRSARPISIHALLAESDMLDT